VFHVFVENGLVVPCMVDKDICPIHRFWPNIPVYNRNENLSEFKKLIELSNATAISSYYSTLS